MSLTGKRILLVLSGGIAAYKSLDLIRRLRERGASVRPVMTEAAQQFVTPLAVGALSASHVYTDLFSREDEQDVGHIRLARDCDLIVVAPASADLMAKMANGLANDLASAVLLATERPILLAPAMNPKMWANAATRRNVATLRGDGVGFIGPLAGEMAESGESGLGRMAEPLDIVAAVEALFDAGPKPLAGRKAIVTSGPTHEPIDPVRYIANRSSGRQGHAIAAALAKLGAEVTLVSGPVTIPDPAGVTTLHVERAEEMLDAVISHLPADIAVMVAAVADWRVATSADQKIKKKQGEGPAPLQLIENPDILKTVGHHERRPKIVVGFAAETQDVEQNGRIKLERKGADLIVANDVSAETGIMGGTRNSVKVISSTGIDVWPDLAKDEVADRLAALIAEKLTGGSGVVTYSLRPAHVCDAAKLPDVEQAASELFRTMPELGWLADAGNIPEDLHRARIPEGTTWVAEGADGEILGFLSAEATPDTLHILELSVLPAHHRQGIGTGLIETATAFAREKQLARVTLTTFRDVPWNAPFYARIGFSMIEDVNLDAYLRGHLDDEATLGMPRERRCAMERAIR